MARTRQSEHIRIKLLDEGVAMFMEQGYHGTGIQEVVDKVGVPKGSFYNYFISKEDFGSKAVIHYSGQFKEFLNTTLEHSKSNSLDALNKFFDSISELSENRDYKGGCLIGNFAAELSDSSKPVRKTMSMCLNEWKNLLREILSTCQDQDVIRKDIPADELADFLINLLEGSTLRMKVEANSEPLKQMKKVFLNYALQK